MNTLDFVGVERSARRLHDEHVRRLFGTWMHGVSEALLHALRGLRPKPHPGAPERFA